MTCPYCHKKVEAENCARIIGVSLKELAKYPTGVKPWPEYIYRCDDCDIEFLWTKGEGIRIIAEPAERRNQ